MATYINGEYYLPTTLRELIFLLSLICMDCLYQLLFINENGEPVFKVTCVCQREWVSDLLTLISFNFSQSFHLVFLLLHCPLIGTSVLASQEDSVITHLFQMTLNLVLWLYSLMKKQYISIQGSAHCY